MSLSSTTSRALCERRGLPASALLLTAVALVSCAAFVSVPLACARRAGHSLGLSLSPTPPLPAAAAVEDKRDGGLTPRRRQAQIRRLHEAASEPHTLKVLSRASPIHEEQEVLAAAEVMSHFHEGTVDFVEPYSLESAAAAVLAKQHAPLKYAHNRSGRPVTVTEGHLSRHSETEHEMSVEGHTPVDYEEEGEEFDVERRVEEAGELALAALEAENEARSSGTRREIDKTFWHKLQELADFKTSPWNLLSAAANKYDSWVRGAKEKKGKKARRSHEH